MPDETPWTVGRLLEWTQKFFEKKGIAQPRLEAEILLAHALGAERIGLYLAYEREVEADARARFREWVRRRAEGEPTRYLVGGCEFMSLAFKVGPGCLIPRPETELLVEEVMARCGKTRGHAPAAEGASARAAVAVIDLCTGCGCVAVSVAVHMPESNVVATDISASALAMARVNAAAHGVADRVAFLEGDLYEVLEAAGAAPADYLVANPPYVAEAEWETLQPEIRNHEPREALVAGPEGAEVIERIVQGAPAYLKPGGTLLVEIGASQGPAVRDLAAGVRGLVDVEIRKDYAGHDRMLVACRAAGGENQDG
ncbi:MAG TPA: peptide chain release factor N(5)-glutamine methyltransferase [Phycisphaerae bacterium]|nr:peptide chain release factor N(5)-glutamine methyltransferase [Phycisphaerae bacterium]